VSSGAAAAAAAAAAAIGVSLPAIVWLVSLRQRDATNECSRGQAEGLVCEEGVYALTEKEFAWTLHRRL